MCWGISLNRLALRTRPYVCNKRLLCTIYQLKNIHGCTTLSISDVSEKVSLRYKSACVQEL